MYTCVYKSSDFKNYKPSHLSSDKMEDDESIGDKFIKRYIWAVGVQRDRINSIFQSIYKEELNVRDSKLTDTYLAIKRIEERNKLSLQFIAQELRDYVGYDIKFFHKWKDEDFHPIKVEIIEKAYTLMKLNKPIIEIEECLFHQHQN